MLFLSVNLNKDIGLHQLRCVTMELFMPTYKKVVVVVVVFCMGINIILKLALGLSTNI